MAIASIVDVRAICDTYKRVIIAWAKGVDKTLISYMDLDTTKSKGTVLVSRCAIYLYECVRAYIYIVHILYIHNMFPVCDSPSFKL